MYRAEIKDKIEQLSMDFVLVDTGDADELADISAQFNSIGEWASEHNDTELSSASSAAAAIIKKMIERGGEDHDAAMESIGRTITEMQRHSREAQREVTPEQAPPSLDAPLPETETPPRIKPIAGGLRHPAQLPDYLDENLFAEFLTLQTEVLQKIENRILLIEETGEESHVKELKRIFHTLKGEAGFLNLFDVEQLCHRTEDIMEEVGKAGLSDILLSVKDWISVAFEYYSGGEAVPSPVGELIYEIEKFGNEPAAPPDVDGAGPPSPPLLVEGAEETARTPTVEEKEPSLTAMKGDGAGAPGTATMDEDAGLSDEELENAFLGTGILDNRTASVFDHFNVFARNSIEVAAQSLVLTRPESIDDDSLAAVRNAFSKLEGAADFMQLKGVRLLSAGARRVVELYTGDKGADVFDLIFETVQLLEIIIDRIGSALTTGEPIDYDPRWGGGFHRLRAFCRESVAINMGPSALKSDKTAACEQISAQTTVDEKQAPAKTEPERPKREKTQGAGFEEPVGKTVEQKGKKQHSGESSNNKRGGDTASKSDPEKPALSTGKKIQTVTESVKVKADRLDRMIDMIGELVIAESMVNQSREIRSLNAPELLRQIGQLNKITRELQEAGLSLRMIPIRATFQKMSRVIRDTARKSGKKVRFTMSGEETELDKTVVDRIGDPLLHMVRNGVDHGIENTPEERSKKGKPETGSVELRAFHRGGSIYIEIEDDGRGLDKEAILHKAFEKGLIDGEKELSDPEIYRLIFEPGFSTAENVTDISGRGVGMDVVKTAVEAINGSVEIETTPAKGSIFTIRLPVTLAIIDGMVVRVRDQRYIIPTLSIITSRAFDNRHTTSIFNRGNMVKIQDHLVPLISMDLLFPASGENAETVRAEKGLLVVVEENGKQAALVVDELLGKQQIVIKPLQESMGKIPGISGGAIMSDGRVSLIIDVETLINFAHEK